VITNSFPFITRVSGPCLNQFGAFGGKSELIGTVPSLPALFLSVYNFTATDTDGKRASVMTENKKSTFAWTTSICVRRCIDLSRHTTSSGRDSPLKYSSIYQHLRVISIRLNQRSRLRATRAYQRATLLLRAREVHSF